MQEEKDLTGRDFVGVSEGDCGKIEVSVPYGINIPSVVDSSDYENLHFLKIYVKSIQRALNSSLVKNEIEDVSKGMKHPIAAVNIVCDYITMGLIVSRVTEEKRTTTGKMDLRRTIQRVVPSYINGDLIYDEYITRKKRIEEDSFVATVQANVINHFIENGGEILFGAKLKVPTKVIKLDRTVVAKLRKELNQTYNSRNQSVIRWMIEYIQGLSVSSDSDKDGKWNYAIVASTLWESMILSVYGNQYPNNKTKYGKKYAFYSISQGKDVLKGSPTQHDVIYEDESQIFIIDAKMYGNPKNLLSEEVLGKQFGYYIEAKRQNPKKKVINILFVPTIPEKGEKDGFADLVITDPHIDMVADPDRIIFLYRCAANQLIDDYFFSKRKYEKLVQEFNRFITEPSVRHFLDARGTSY